MGQSWIGIFFVVVQLGTGLLCTQNNLIVALWEPTTPFENWNNKYGINCTSLLCLLRLWSRKKYSIMWIRFSRVVRASDSQCRSRNCPGFDPSVLWHSGVWGAAHETVLNTVHKNIKKISWALSTGAAFLDAVSLTFLTSQYWLYIVQYSSIIPYGTWKQRHFVRFGILIRFLTYDLSRQVSNRVGPHQGTDSSGKWNF